MLDKQHRPFQFRLRTALLVMSVCCIAALPLGYFVRWWQRPQRRYFPVSGVVALNGQPLADANVEFVSDDDPTRTPAKGITDSTGQFNLVTFVDVGSPTFWISASRGTKSRGGAAFAVGGKGKTSLNILTGQIGEIVEHLIDGHASREIRQHVVYGNPHSANTGLSAAFAWLDGNA